MPKKRSRKLIPKVFVGCQVASLDLAHRLQEALQDEADVTVWTEDVFRLSESALSGFQRVLEGADCALFIAEDAPQAKRESPLSINLVLELGMSIGYLGAERTSLLTARSSFQLPADLRGLSFFHLSRRAKTNSRTGLLPLDVLRRWIRGVGRRETRSKEYAQPADVFPKVLKASRNGRKRTTKSRRVSARNMVFISYAHADARWLARISTMLTPLVRSEHISVWDDNAIKPGTKWHSEIKKAISSSKVALLLVSPAFLASAFIAGNELPPILDAAEEDGLVIIWALVSACLYRKTPLADYQAAHPIARPLDSLPAPKRNQALLAIAESVGTALESGSRRA
jgi:predicted nucleotide-binding protein